MPVLSERPTDALSDEILAALSIGGALSCAEMARRCPSAMEVHAVSTRVWTMVRTGHIERAAGNGRPRYRVRPGVSAPVEAVLKVGQRADGLGEDLPPATALLRQEILKTLRDHGRAMSRDEISQCCPSARSRHEVSQQVNALVRQGAVQGAVGPHGRRGASARYWAVPGFQNELPLSGEIEASAPKLRREGRGWALDFTPGRCRASISRPLAPGVTGAYSHDGRLLRLSVDAGVVAPARG